MKMFLLLKSIFSEQRLDQRGVGRGRRGRVGVFALNYATSCGNVCHQIGERGSRGRGQRAERERQQGEQKAGAVAENEEWGGGGSIVASLSAAETISLFSTRKAIKGNKTKAACVDSDVD